MLLSPGAAARAAEVSRTTRGFKMALRLKWYEKRTKGKIDEENVVAAIHVHTHWLLMFLPEILHPFVGRHVVVTNKRTVIFGPGMKKIVAEYPRGAANASRSGFHVTIGDQKLFAGALLGPMKRIADQVVNAANSPAGAAA
jgi:hypothetical protein